MSCVMSFEMIFFPFQLHTKLKFDELAKFSNLLKSWNYSSNRLPEFCEKLLSLYGPERKHLLAGMVDLTLKFINFRTLENFALNTPKIQTKRPNHIQQYFLQ